MLFHETRKQSTSLNDRQWEMLTHQPCGLLSGPATKGQNSAINMGDHERSELQT